MFQLADFCVTDTALKSDEEQIFAQIMSIAGNDPSGDAVACRVKLILIFNGTPTEIVEFPAIVSKKFLFFFLIMTWVPLLGGVIYVGMFIVPFSISEIRMVRI